MKKVSAAGIASLIIGCSEPMREEFDATLDAMSDTGENVALAYDRSDVVNAEMPRDAEETDQRDVLDVESVIDVDLDDRPSAMSDGADTASDRPTDVPLSEANILDGNTWEDVHISDASEGVDAVALDGSAATDADVSDGSSRTDVDVGDRSARADSDAATDIADVFGLTACPGLDGGEVFVNTRIHRNHCGGCGRRCCGGFCIEGVCAAEGPPGTAACPLTPEEERALGCFGPARVDISADPNNCGGCGVRCPSGRVCRLGNCE